MIESAPVSRPRSVVAIALALLAAACSVAIEPQIQEGPPFSIEIPQPDTIDWRRSIAGFDVAGSGTDPDPDELAMLERALEELPDSLVASAEVRTIYRVPEAPPSATDTAGYAIGPDIYLIDDTFRDLGTGMTTFDLIRLLAHEMTHTAQFARLTDRDLTIAAKQELDDAIPTSDFVATFADAAGWSDRGRASGIPDWVLTNPDGTTAYGATAPEEDMAESVAELVAGPEPSVSSVRTQWVESWLGTPSARLSGGRPWTPAGSDRIVTEEPFYDEAEVARRTSGFEEVLSYAVPADVPELSALAAAVGRSLNDRGVSGSLQPIQDGRIARAGGFFVRGDGIGYWVELWDFRDAPGYVDPPATPVLTYVVLWR